MKAPAFYGAFCVAVLALFLYAKIEGRVPFDTSPGTGTSGTGGHGGGVFLGSHK